MYGTARVKHTTLSEFEELVATHNNERLRTFALESLGSFVLDI